MKYSRVAFNRLLACFRVHVSLEYAAQAVCSHFIVIWLSSPLVVACQSAWKLHPLPTRLSNLRTAFPLVRHLHHVLIVRNTLGYIYFDPFSRFLSRRKHLATFGFVILQQCPDSSSSSIVFNIFYLICDIQPAWL